jgi:hypothetical protein
MQEYEKDFSKKGKNYKDKFMKAIKEQKNITFDDNGRIILMKDQSKVEVSKEIHEVPCIII